MADDPRIPALEEAVRLLSEERQLLVDSLQANLTATAEIKQQTAEIVAFWNGAKAGIEVLGVLGRLAKPIAAIAAAVAACGAAWYAITHWGQAPVLPKL